MNCSRPNQPLLGAPLRSGPFMQRPTVPRQDSNAPKPSSSDPESAQAAALAAKKEALKRKFDEQYDDPESSKLDFYTEKKDEMARTV